MLNSNTWNHLTVCKQMKFKLKKKNCYFKLFAHKSWAYEDDLELNNL